MPHLRLALLAGAIWLGASALGVVIGWAVHHVFVLLLAGLHVAGALKHVVIDRDGLLQRMWFGR